MTGVAIEVDAVDSVAGAVETVVLVADQVVDRAAEVVSKEIDNPIENK